MCPRTTDTFGFAPLLFTEGLLAPLNLSTSQPLEARIGWLDEAVPGQKLTVIHRQEALANKTPTAAPESQPMVLTVLQSSRGLKGFLVLPSWIPTRHPQASCDPRDPTWAHVPVP